MPSAANEPIPTTSLKYPNSKTLFLKQAGNLIAWEKGLALFKAVGTVDLKFSFFL